MKNLVEAHNRVKDFDWEPSYHPAPERYPTKYKIPAKTKDPFRHLIRDYCSMEQEKDDRQYGALEDAIARSGSTGEASERWSEILKIALPVLTFGEYGAMKCCGQLIDTVDNAALRQGYMAQMLDEVRHINQETYLNRYMAKHAPDPEGFDRAVPLKSLNVFGRASQSALECFFVGDPIEGALNLQVVAETAYTNSIFVAMTQMAAQNGDQATPTVFLSIQSDEARHMANGYSTLAAVLAEPDNLPVLQQDFDRAFWRQHAFLDPFV
ncbi:MAG: monooxygenase, partial [Myxococcales bacterium]|nr:monooxygenase [Myxococcales bacterium]